MNGTHMTTSSRPQAEHAVGSIGQCMLWLMETQVGGPGVMNVPIIYRMRGPLRVSALSAALTRLVERHEMLRTSFEWHELPPPDQSWLSQWVHPTAEVSVKCVDVSAEDDPYEAAYDGIRARLVQDIDVTTGPPFTVDLYRLSSDDHLLMVNVHHLVTDAWSNMLICRDLGELYNNEVGAPGKEPESVDWTFRRYAEWLQERSNGPVGEANAAFWRKELGAMKYLDLRPAPHRAANKKPPTENVWFAVEGPRIDRLRELAKEQRTTLFVVMLALFYSVLHTVSGENDITVGSVFANRIRRELNNTVGCFADMIPLGIHLSADPSFEDALRVTRRTVLEALGHQEFPYLVMISDPSMPPGAIRSSEIVFHMLAVPESVSPPSGITFSGLQAEVHPIPDGMGSRFDLELLIIPQIGTLEGVFRYAGDRYEKEFVERLSRRYQDLIDAVVKNPGVPLANFLKNLSGDLRRQPGNPVCRRCRRAIYLLRRSDPTSLIGHVREGGSE
jgi:hypothetical protein